MRLNENWLLPYVSPFYLILESNYLRQLNSFVRRLMALLETFFLFFMEGSPVSSPIHQWTGRRGLRTLLSNQIFSSCSFRVMVPSKQRNTLGRGRGGRHAEGSTKGLVCYPPRRRNSFFHFTLSCIHASIAYALDG